MIRPNSHNRHHRRPPQVSQRRRVGRVLQVVLASRSSASGVSQLKLTDERDADIQARTKAISDLQASSGRASDAHPR
jgi:hypothetical protein